MVLGTVYVADMCAKNPHLSRNVEACARLAQLVRSLTANQKVPGSIPGLVEATFFRHIVRGQGR